MLKSEQRFGPDIENGFADLLPIVDEFAHKHVVGQVASYRLDEALGMSRRVGDVAIREVRMATEEIRSARAAVEALSIVPPVMDFAEGLIDREIRDVVRGLSAAERGALLKQMHEGQQVRATLALARHPMPADFDVEAGKLYGQFSEPSKRSHLALRVEVYEAKREAAKTLREAADATKAVVARFVALEAARDATAQVQEIARQAATITYPDSSPAVAKSAAPTPARKASVRVEDNAILTRID